MSSREFSGPGPKSNVGIRVTNNLLSHDFSHKDNNNDSHHRHDRSGLVSRLGKVSTVVLVSSFALYLGCLAFLTFLWAADTNNAVWRRIVLAGWTTRSVTILSLVLRSTAASQAMTCTSMLAAVLLQAYAVPLPTSAAVSIMRFDNTGPWSLLNSMRAERYYGSVWMALPIVLLSFTTAALQFTSTILLSQVGRANLPVSTSVPQTYYGVDPNGLSFRSQLSGVQSYVDTTPTGYPAFAEWVANATVPGTTEFAPDSRPGMKDTGTVIRAFLPIGNNDNRSRLMDYQGFATVVDMRVVCMLPNLTNVAYSSRDGYRISGLVGPEEYPRGSLGQLTSGSGSSSMSFDCPFEAANGNVSSSDISWPLALCVPENSHSIQGISSVMDPAGQEEIGQSYLLINATSTDQVMTLDGSDVWVSMSLAANDSSDLKVTFQITLCMSSFEAQEMEIHATRPASIPSEPALIWDTATATFNTSAVQRQLGALKSSVSIVERGIFDLAPRSWQWPTRPEYIDLTGGTFSTTSALDGVTFAEGLYNVYMNQAQYSIFSQMVSSTTDPALALQAFFTTLFAITYYDRIILFDTAAPSSQVSLVQVIRPLGWTAYIVVVSVVLLHLLLVLLTTWIFWRAGKLSRVGNAWTAISQILGPDTEDWIKDADTVDDKMVKAWLKARGLHKTLVQVEEVQGRVQFIRKNKVH